MKIIHISDLHFPDTDTRMSDLINKIIEHYSEVKGAKPIVVISGDIMHSSVKKRCFKVAKQKLKKLKDEGFTLLICPGNHDLKLEGIGPIINGRKRFHNYFSGLLPKGVNYYGEEDNDLYDFPIVHQFDDHFFIGLDTLAAENGLGANGELGTEQLEDLADTLEDLRENHPAPKLIVYLHHHPLKFSYRHELMKLKDKEKFLETVKGIDIMLFGHLHKNERFAADEKKYGIGCILLSGGCVYGSNIDWAEVDTETYEVKRMRFNIGRV